MALEGTIVLMPVPVKPPHIPTTSRVGRSHLQAVEQVTGAPYLRREVPWPCTVCCDCNHEGSGQRKKCIGDPHLT